MTATDIVTIMGLSSYSSPWVLWHDKKGLLPPWEGNDRTAVGSALQPYVAARWEQATGLRLEQSENLFRSHDRAWQMATPDGLVLPAADLATWEAKTWDDQDRAAWDSGPPPKVRAQVLWQMDTLNVATGHVGVVFLPSGEFRSYVIEHDQVRIASVDATIPASTHDPACRVCADQDVMRERGVEFCQLLQADRPPPLDGSATTLAGVKRLHAGVLAGQAELDRSLWAGYEEARDSVRDAERHLRLAESELRQALGGAEVGTVGGAAVVRRQMVAVKEHFRKASVQDRLTRIKRGDAGE